MERIERGRTGCAVSFRILCRVLRAVLGVGMTGVRITSETPCCEECGKPLPFGASSLTRFCSDCSKKHRAKNARDYYWKHKDELDAASVETYYWYKERGICVNCHRREAEVLPDGKRLVRCKKCLAKGQKYQRKCRRKKKKMA